MRASTAFGADGMGQCYKFQKKIKLGQEKLLKS